MPSNLRRGYHNLMKKFMGQTLSFWCSKISRVPAFIIQILVIIPLCIFVSLSYTQTASADDDPPGDTPSEQNSQPNDPSDPQESTEDPTNTTTIRILDPTTHEEIDQLLFDLIPKPTGVSATKRAIVEVTTTNATGYRLYMESNYQKNGTYTTSLVNTKSDIDDAIPTSIEPSTLFWNYINPHSDTTAVIPAHDYPDKVGQLDEQTTGDDTSIDVNLTVDTSIVPGTYQNQLLFTVINNPSTVDYKVSFDTDGGTPQIADLTATAAAGVHTFTLPDTTPTKQDVYFSHWLDPDTENIYHPGDTIDVYSDEDYKGEVTLIAQYSEEFQPTLTVDPNGGTWSGKTTPQQFSQKTGTSKTIANPTAGPTYSISYSDNNQSASFVGTPTSVERNFANWALTGDGTYSYGTYVFGDNDGALTAEYTTTSKVFTLPTITKPNHVCKWAEGSVTGGRYSGGSIRTITENTTYYAVCESTDWSDLTTMQEMTPAMCSNASIDSTTTLTDSRDNNTYSIRKLKDGNCWMTQNLSLSAAENDTLTPATSDVLTNVNWSAETDDCSSANTSSVCMADSGIQDYGYYYNWTAATAKSGTSDITSGNAQYSICPKGWRLPTGGDTGEMQALYDQYSSPDLMMGEPALVLSGRRNGKNTGSQNSYGYYWTSTARDTDNAYYLYLYKSNVRPAANNGKYLGLTVRCLARLDPIEFTLTVDPNGGIWHDQSTSQDFDQEFGTTKSISTPSKNAAYTISYDGNGQSATFEPEPTEAERAFTGWSLSGQGSYALGVYTYGAGNGTLSATYNTASNSFTLPDITKTDSDCKWAEGSPSGTQYAGGATRSVSADTTYYAVCKDKTISDISKMQEITPTICENSSLDETATLEDVRDSRSYEIKKLADGRCWMIQNLRFISPTKGYIDETDSDVQSRLPSDESTQWSSIVTTSCSNNEDFCIFDSNTDDIGAYYSWYAATATSGTTSTVSANAPDSICPKGWRLPTGGPTGEFKLLYDQYPSSAEMRSTDGPGFLLGGIRLGATIYYKNTYGYYWSSLGYNANSAGRLYFDVNNVGPSDNITKNYGDSVRCIVDQ